MSIHSDRITNTAPVNLVSGKTSSLTKQRRAYRMALFFSDGVMLALAFWLAYWVRFDAKLALQPEAALRPEFYRDLGLLMLPIGLGLFALFGLYNWTSLLGGTAEYSRVFHACTTGIMMIVVASFLQPSFIVARGWLIYFWLTSIFLVILARFLGRRVVYRLRSRGYFRVRTLVVGANGEALALCRELSGSRSSDLEILGLINGFHRDSPHAASGLPLLGTMNDFDDLIRDHGIERILIALTAVEREELFRLYEQVARYEHLELWLSSGLIELLTTGMEVRAFGSVSVMSLTRLRLNPMEQSVKTAFDFVLALGTLIAAGPLILGLSLLVRLTTPGPVFHRRRVVGLNGRKFDAFKFRTMYTDGERRLAGNPGLETELQTHGKLKDDPRVTSIGRWLRRYSLDEIPQLFNVLMGQMSLVGPRMISPEEEAHYGKHKWSLVTVKPGITGLWQVSGRSDLSYRERVQLDMHYIRNYSIWKDLQILLVQTPLAVLKGQGAY